MPGKGWSPGVLVLQAITALVSWCHIGGPGLAEAVVAYSSRHDRTTTRLDEESLKSFPDLWKHIFLWGFSSMLFIHIVSSSIGFLMLRKHKYGRFSGAFILLLGTCTTFVMCAATSAAVGFVLYQAQIELSPIKAMICGITQTALFLFFAFSKFMPTL